MNDMNKNNTEKKYKIVKNVDDQIGIVDVPKMIVQFGLLAMICVLAFLVAKYIVRSAIDGENTPIDTSERV